MVAARPQVPHRRPKAGLIHIEPRVGGRLFESFEVGEAESGQTAAQTKVVETGRVTVWEPPFRLVFDWRAVNFSDAEKTEVEVTFEPGPGGTLVTITHRGWSKIRPDHPARHGLDVAAFVRMMGLWWGELLTSLREHVTTRNRP